MSESRKDSGSKKTTDVPDNNVVNPQEDQHLTHTESGTISNEKNDNSETSRTASGSLKRVPLLNLLTKKNEKNVEFTDIKESSSNIRKSFIQSLAGSGEMSISNKRSSSLASSMGMMTTSTGLDTVAGSGYSSRSNPSSTRSSPSTRSISSPSSSQSQLISNISNSGSRFSIKSSKGIELQIEELHYSSDIKLVKSKDRINEKDLNHIKKDHLNKMLKIAYDKIEENRSKNITTFSLYFDTKSARLLESNTNESYHQLLVNDKGNIINYYFFPENKVVLGSGGVGTVTLGYKLLVDPKINQLEKDYKNWIESAVAVKVMHSKTEVKDIESIVDALDTQYVDHSTSSTSSSKPYFVMKYEDGCINYKDYMFEFNKAPNNKVIENNVATVKPKDLNLINYPDKDDFIKEYKERYKTVFPFEETPEFVKGKSYIRPRIRLITFLELIKRGNALHAKNIIHSDLKLENTLLFRDHHGKYIDYDDTTKNPKYFINDQVGTWGYRDPEIENHHYFLTEIKPFERVRKNEIQVESRDDGLHYKTSTSNGEQIIPWSELTVERKNEKTHHSKPFNAECKELADIQKHKDIILRKLTEKEHIGKVVSKKSDNFAIGMMGGMQLDFTNTEKVSRQLSIDKQNEIDTVNATLEYDVQKTMKLYEDEIRQKYKADKKLPPKISDIDITTDQYKPMSQINIPEYVITALTEKSIYPKLGEIQVATCEQGLRYRTSLSEGETLIPWNEFKKRKNEKIKHAKQLPDCKELADIQKHKDIICQKVAEKDKEIQEITTVLNTIERNLRSEVDDRRIVEIEAKCLQSISYNDIYTKLMPYVFNELFLHEILGKEEDLLEKWIGLDITELFAKYLEPKFKDYLPEDINKLKQIPLDIIDEFVFQIYIAPQWAKIEAHLLNSADCMRPDEITMKKFEDEIEQLIKTFDVQSKRHHSIYRLIEQEKLLGLDSSLASCIHLKPSEPLLKRADIDKIIKYNDNLRKSRSNLLTRKSHYKNIDRAISKEREIQAENNNEIKKINSIEDIKKSKTHKHKSDSSDTKSISSTIENKKPKFYKNKSENSNEIKSIVSTEESKKIKNYNNKNDTFTFFTRENYISDNSRFLTTSNKDINSVKSEGKSDDNVVITNKKTNG